MMTSKEVLKKLEQLGNEGTAKVLMKHGAKYPCYGVKVAELKKIQKQVKTNHGLAIELFNSGVFDAMYLAGLIMDGASMTKKELMSWADTNYGSSISSYTVPWVATENKLGPELALQWIESDKEFVAVSGWATLSCIVSIRSDEELDIDLLRKLLNRVIENIHTSPNKVKQAMNNFVISLGCYVTPLSAEALKAAEKIGKVKVDVGDTNCKIPAATEYINKLKAKGAIGKKRKEIKC
jgi:3-methyladenine DNA glycosylase AlkD